MKKSIEVTDAEIREIIVGLLEIAEIVMPDTYFVTDSRVKRAKRLLVKLTKRDALKQMLRVI